LTIIEGFTVDKKLTEPQHRQQLKWLAQLAASLFPFESTALLPEKITRVTTYSHYCLKLQLQCLL